MRCEKATGGSNEAEASLPRNGKRRCRGPHPSTRFNEAEASLPRNADNFRDGAQVIGVASMRPRQACLGMSNPDQPTPTNPRRFNEAEASLPRNGARVQDTIRLRDGLQ